MTKYNRSVPSCKLCYFGSRVFGHGLTNLIGKKYNKITLEQVGPCLAGLNLTIVGGLNNRGYTEHDIDVVGDKKDIKEFIKRLSEINIDSLVHYCGPSGLKHSHIVALVNGFQVTFLGNQIYFKN